MKKLNRVKKLIAEFGVNVTIAKLFQSATRNIPYIKHIAGQWKYKAITKFLYKENEDILLSFNRTEIEKLRPIGAESPVWMFWWQGIEKAPEIVKVCMNSVRKNSGIHPLILLEENNYQGFVDVPEIYNTFLEDGKISHTQYSDILRLNLLYQRGGGYGLILHICLLMN